MALERAPTMESEKVENLAWERVDMMAETLETAREEV